MSLAEQLISRYLGEDFDDLAQDHNGRLTGTSGSGPGTKDVYLFPKDKDAKDFASAAKKKGAKTSMRKAPSGKGFEVLL